MPRVCHSAATHTGAEFTAKWEGRHSGSSSVSFANRCPRANRGLSSREYLTVLAYILKMNGMPAGAADLPADSSGLVRIRINFKLPRDTSHVRY